MNYTSNFTQNPYATVSPTLEPVVGKVYVSEKTNVVYMVTRIGCGDIYVFTLYNNGGSSGWAVGTINLVTRTYFAKNMRPLHPHEKLTFTGV